MKRSAFVLMMLLAGCGGRAASDMSSASEPGLTVATAAMQGGSPQIALQVAGNILARNPGNEAALVTQGDALTALGRPDEATLSYNKALQRNSASVGADIGLGRLHLASDPAGAEALFLEALQHDPRNVTALNDLGVARDLQRHHVAAQEAYRQALGISPEDSAAQVNLALSLAMSGASGDAVRLLRPLASDSGASRKLRHDLAAVLAMAGDRREAEAILSSDLSPEDVRKALDAYASARTADAVPFAAAAPPPAPQPTVIAAPVAAPVSAAAPAVAAAPPARPQPTVIAAPVAAPVSAAAPAVAAAPPARPQPTVIAAPVAAPAPPAAPAVAAAPPARPQPTVIAAPVAAPAPPAAPAVAAAPPATPQPTVIAAPVAAPAPAPAPAVAAAPPATPQRTVVAAAVTAPVSTPAPATAATPPATPQPTVIAAPVSAPGSSDGSVQIQFTAADSEIAAWLEWQRLQGRMPNLLGDRAPEVMRVERGGHVYWRLRTGGFANTPQAEAFCQQVREAGGACVVGGA